jgi:protein-tyrosine phosphatase
MNDADPTAIDLEVDPREQRIFGVTAHGDIPFDIPVISQIEGNLWTGGCQDGLVLPEFFEHVVSLYPWERYEVRHELTTGRSVRMLDSPDQATDEIDELAEWVSACMNDGPTLVHCQAGLNRSSLVAAATLIRRGSTPEDAIALLRERRSPAVLCNEAFERWLLEEYSP